MVKVSFKLVSVERIGSPDDIKEGYVRFEVVYDVEGRQLVLQKKIRLDKPDKMLSKFLTKIPVLAEQEYVNVKYFVADKNPPEDLDFLFVNRGDVEEKLYLIFEEIEQFVKTSKYNILVNHKIRF